MEPFWNEWIDNGGGRNRAGQKLFLDGYDAFASTVPLAYEDINDQLDSWDDFMQTWLLDRGRGKANREAWFRRNNIDPRDFDWAGWRDAMGYKARRGR